jgi:hypothetical protein
MSKLLKPVIVALLVLVVFLTVGADEPSGELTPELIVSVVAAVIALALDLMPGLAPWWENLPTEVKRFAWLAGCLLVGVIPWAVNCLLKVPFWIRVVCTPLGFVDVLSMGFMAYFSSQAVHGLASLGKKVARGGEGEIPF